MTTQYGKVYLVGAGPGDPGLITVRGRECIARADVIIYDALANAQLLEDARPDAERIFVGKERDRHTLIQEEINRLLVEWAGKASHVVRLKGGDPFVFGRGGEEALLLAEHKIPFEVVPGVTAGIAVPAYAGIPVTHRGMATSVTLITGHNRENEPGKRLALDNIALTGTLVFYMGVKNLPTVVDELRRVGRPAATPAAVIEWGTYGRQRTVLATLDTLVARCAEAGVQPPAVVVVGEVARLHEAIPWFERRPLFGKRIAVTRSRSQASELVRALRAMGADVFEFPTIQIMPAETLDDFGYIGDYDWIVFTSVNGVDMLFDRLDALGNDARDLHGVRLCVIGSATAEAVRKRFLRIDAMPEKYVAEELMAELLKHHPDMRGKRVLLPRADIARSFLPEALRAHGAEVTELVAYRTVMPKSSEALVDALMTFAPGLVTFSSSSTVRNFCHLLGAERMDALKTRAVFTAIGPITARTARELGVHPAIEAEEHSIPGLIQAIVEWAAAHSGD